jgi:hypothetical protein
MIKLNKEQISTLREKFVLSYCKKMNWNHNELSTNQMLLITSQKDYISPKQ